MPNVYDLALEFRAALLRQERAAASQLVTAYAIASERLKLQISPLLVQIAQAQARGETVNPAWLRQSERLLTLQALVEAEITRLLPAIETNLTNLQSEAILSAQNNAHQLTVAALGSGPSDAQAIVRASLTRLPTAAIETMVGFSSDGAPLRKLLSALPGDASARVIEALQAAIVTGQTPRQTARAIRDALGGNLARALTISRTETVRAYREATRQTYEANSDVVTGWTWVASLTSRTCLACAAMHGTFHKNDERLNGHPNCRCVMVPRTKSWAELGFADIPDRRTEIEPGADWFARQPESVQAAMMNKEAFAAYSRGEVTLNDFVGIRRSQQWGSMRYERSWIDIAKGKGQMPKGKFEPAPMKPIGPAGKPVSEALTVPKRGKLADIARNALQAINDVHGDGELPTIPLESDRSTKRQGAYWYQRSSGIARAQKITISSVSNTYPDVAVVHEVGHFLDQQGIGIQAYASLNDPRLAAWRKAIEESRAAAELKQLAAASAGAGVSKRYVEYLSQWVEMWARSYSQYIAVRSQNTVMRDQINVLRQRKGKVYYPLHWDDDDFEPIAEAFDELMLNLRWRK